MALKIRTLLACGVAALPTMAAAAEPRAINVPSEEAAKSIPEFARQENIQIIAPVGQLHGIKTPAVTGAMAMNTAYRRKAHEPRLFDHAGAVRVWRKCPAPSV